MRLRWEEVLAAAFRFRFNNYQIMKNKLIGILGILTSLFFFIGFWGLFFMNPQTFAELNNLSISAYNLDGMDGRIWVSSIVYILAGLLNIIVALLLVKATKSSVTLAGEIFILITGGIWLSFGLITYEVNTDLGNHLFIIRTITMLVTSTIGLLLFGLELERVTNDIFLKYYTIGTGLIILLLCILSLFVYNDDTWIRTNISFTIYFTWFGILGIRVFRR